jgi:hypothetical protein
VVVTADRARCPSCKRWLTSAAASAADPAVDVWLKAGNRKGTGWRAQLILVLMLAAMIRGVVAFLGDLW